MYFVEFAVNRRDCSPFVIRPFVVAALSGCCGLWPIPDLNLLAAVVAIELQSMAVEYWRQLIGHFAAQMPLDQ